MLNFEKLKKVQPARILLIAAGVIIFLLIVKFIYARVVISQTRHNISNAIGKTPDQNDFIKKIAEEDVKKIAELKKNNPFVPTPQEPGPPSSVEGILGQKALMNGQWLSVGDSINGAKILEIKPTCVVIDWKGEKKEVLVAMGSMPDVNRANGPPMGNGPVNTTNAPGPPGGSISQDKMQMLMNMSPDQRKELEAKLKTMSPEQRQAYIESMK
jgi:type II secretory pathway component PulC